MSTVTASSMFALPSELKQLAALGGVIVVAGKLVKPPGIAYTYLWLILSGVAWLWDSTECLALCFAQGFCLNLTWFVSQSVEPSLWLSVEGYWENILPKKVTTLIVRTGDILLHPAPLLLLVGSAQFLTTEACLYVLLLERFYICLTEAHVWGTGRNLNKIYKFTPHQPPHLYTTLQLLSFVVNFGLLGVTCPWIPVRLAAVPIFFFLFVRLARARRRRHGSTTPVTPETSSYVTPSNATPSNSLTKGGFRASLSVTPMTAASVTSSPKSGAASWRYKSPIFPKGDDAPKDIKDEEFPSKRRIQNSPLPLSCQPADDWPREDNVIKRRRVMALDSIDAHSREPSMEEEDDDKDKSKDRSEKGKTTDSSSHLSSDCETDINNQEIDNQEIDNQEIDNQEIDNQEIDNQEIDNQEIDNQEIDNQAIDNQAIDNQEIDNQEIDN
eukprot:Selendium_serpulae@DN2686_c0_g1_i1.p1